MIHTLSPPPRADSTRRDTVQRRHQHLQQDWKQRASPANVKRWMTGGLIIALICSRWDGFQWMTDREGQGRRPSVIRLKILESFCWVLLWINAIWLVASAIRRVSYSKEKRLKTHRRVCNKPSRQPADRLTYNTEQEKNVTCVLNGQYDFNFTG